MAKVTMAMGRSGETCADVLVTEAMREEAQQRAQLVYEAQQWRMVREKVHELDAIDRPTEGPGMGDDDILPIVLQVLERVAKEAKKANLKDAVYSIVNVHLVRGQGKNAEHRNVQGLMFLGAWESVDDSRRFRASVNAAYPGWRARGMGRVGGSEQE